MTTADPLPTRMGYDAIAKTTRRALPKVDLRGEDEVLRQEYREKLVSTARDARRNHGVAAWMIRKHLDFVSDFSFQAHTGNDKLDEQIEKLVARRCLRQNCHTASRHPMRRLVRIAEACRTVDGDGVWEKVKGGKLNFIRGDRIRNPLGVRYDEGWRNGVKVNEAGEALGFAIHKRTIYGRYVYEKFLPAENAVHHAYWDDSDQIRGVSPLSTALNNLRDVYEGTDYALAKMKIDQLMGLKITKGNQGDGSQPSPFAGNRHFDEAEIGGENPEETTGEDVGNGSPPEDLRRYGMVDYGKGIFQMELDPGDDAELMAGTSPSPQFQQFTDTTIGMALKALDLPYSFWREDYTNFFGSRGALQLYLRSAVHKQRDNQENLAELTQWWLVQDILDGELELPGSMTVADVVFEWIPRGIPWWDRAKEITGDLKAITAGLDNPLDICRDHGSGDFFENIDKTAEAVKYAQEKLGPLGMQLNFEPVPQLAPAPTDDDDDKKQKR